VRSVIRFQEWWVGLLNVVARRRARAACCASLNIAESTKLRTRRTSLEAVGEFSTQRTWVLEELIKELDKDVRVRKPALQSIADMVAREEFVVDAVMRCLEDEDDTVREVAVQTLAKMDRKGDDNVIHALTARRGDPSFRVRVKVLQVWPSVAEKGDPRAVHAMATLLEHDDPDVRREVATAMQVMAHKGDEGVFLAVAARLQHPDVFVRISAIHALSVLAGGQERTRVALEACAHDEDETVVRLAAQSLERRSQ